MFDNNQIDVPSARQYGGIGESRNFIISYDIHYCSIFTTLQWSETEASITYGEGYLTLHRMRVMYLRLRVTLETSKLRKYLRTKLTWGTSVRLGLGLQSRIETQLPRVCLIFSLYIEIPSYVITTYS